jgi:hypothetical protein
MVRKRAPKISAAQSSSATPSTKARNQNLGTTTAMSEQQALLGTGSSPALSQPHLNGDNIEEEQEGDTMDNLSKKSQWIVLAIASGACAAFNGVFAKLYVHTLFSLFITFLCTCPPYSWSSTYLILYETGRTDFYIFPRKLNLYLDSCVVQPVLVPDSGSDATVTFPRTTNGLHYLTLLTKPAF